MQRLEFDLRPERPYSLSRTVSRLVRFTQLVDRVRDDGRDFLYRRCLHLGAGLALLSVTQSGTVANAMLRVTLAGDSLLRTASPCRVRRFEALEPIRQGVRERFGPIGDGVADGLRLRHDHGSNYLADDFQQEVAFFGISP